MKPSDLLFKFYKAERADEVLEIINRWVSGAFQFKADGKVSKDKSIDGYDYQEKAATTTVDGAGGFLVPETVRAEVARVLGAYGRLLPFLSSMTLPAGAKVRVNELATAPTVTFPGAECTALVEAVPAMADPAQVLSMHYVGAYMDVSNELFLHPGANTSRVLFDWLIEAVVQAEECAILNNSSSTPNEGIFFDSAVVDGDPIKMSANGQFNEFVEQAIVQNPALGNPDRTVIVTLPEVLPLIARTEPNTFTACGGLGKQPQFLCTPVIPHPCAKFASPWGAAIFNPRHVVYATDGAITLDVNPYKGFTKNCTGIKVGQHFGFAILLANMMRRAIVEKVVP